MLPISPGLIEYDFFHSRFGECLIARSSKGICDLDFVDQSRAEALHRLTNVHANERILECNGKLAGLAETAFRPMIANGPGIHLRGTEFQLAVWNTLLEIPAGTTVASPYLVEVQAVTPGTLVLPRLVISAGDGSEASVVVYYRSPDGTPLVTVPHIEVQAGVNTNISVTVIQLWGNETTAIAQQHYVAGRDASLEMAEVGLGGRFARLHMTMDMEGQGSDARVLGMYFGDGNQTLDYRAFMNHRAPNSTSDMFLKGAVGDGARSVFTGLIRIEPDAQKVHAHQTNRNLVLSEGAEAHSVPNLEILANEVRCGHGSAVGPLDAEQRYYLMSRGLDRAAADRLQVKGFFEDVLARFRHPGLEPPLRRAAMAKYAGIMERNRA